MIEFIKALAYTSFSIALLPLFGLLGVFFRYFKKYDNAKELNASAAKDLGATSTFVRLEANNVELHVVTAGEDLQTNPVAVLLHGFPDSWHTWHNQIPELVKAGYFVVAPDMRGYNLSEKKEGVNNYDPDILASDVAELIKYYKRDKVVLFGHDWGAAVAWHFARLYPELLSKLVILNVPYPIAFDKNMSVTQLLKSWYMFFFQLPYLPELTLSGQTFLGPFVFPTSLALSKLYSPLYWKLLHSAVMQPQAATCTINYYRAMARSKLSKRGPNKPKLNKNVEVPTLILFGIKDKYLSPTLLTGTEQWVPNITIKTFDVGHWVHIEAPEQINENIVSYLKE